MIQNQIKAARLAKGLSQEELAVRIHVVRQTVSKWETGLSVPDAQMLIRIAQVLETPVSVLLGEEPVQDGETSPETTGQIAQKLERLNKEMAEKNAASRRRLRIGAVCTIVLAAVLLVFLLLTGADVLLRQPSGPGVIGGADGPTDILVFSGMQGPGVGISTFLCVFVITAAAIVLHRTK